VFKKKKKENFVKDKSFWNLFKWLFGGFISVIWLFSVPVARHLNFEGYNGWKSDVFSNSTIITLSISLVFAAVLVIYTRRQKLKTDPYLLFFLFIIFAVGVAYYPYIKYNAEYELIAKYKDAGITEYADFLEKIEPVNTDLLILQMWFLITSAVFGALSFIPGKKHEECIYIYVDAKDVLQKVELRLVKGKHSEKHSWEAERVRYKNILDGDD